MANVLLFGGGLQSLSIARGLKDEEHNVINISDSASVGKYSKFIDSFYSIQLATATVSSIIEFINKHQIDILIPTEDEYAEWLSSYRDAIELNSNCRCAIVDKKLFSRVINKSDLLEFCRNNNIPHPITSRVSVDSINDAVQRVGFPALIKPNISNGSRGIVPVNDIKELRDKLPNIISQYGECSLQEFIYNPDHYYNCMLYRYSDGSFGPSVVTKITRFYPIKGGSSSFCTTIENPKIVDICSRLLSELNWTGFADFDILEKGEGDFRIIEINPRVPASLHAAYVSGVDFGEIIVDDLLGLPRPPMRYIPGEQLRFLGLDLAWFLSSSNRFSSTPSWFKFFGPHLHYQEGGLKDYRAMIYSIWRGVLKQLSPSFRKSKSGMN